MAEVACNEATQSFSSRRAPNGQTITTLSPQAQELVRLYTTAAVYPAVLPKVREAQIELAFTLLPMETARPQGLPERFLMELKLPLLLTACQKPDKHWIYFLGADVQSVSFLDVPRELPCTLGVLIQGGDAQTRGQKWVVPSGGYVFTVPTAPPPVAVARAETAVIARSLIAALPEAEETDEDSTVAAAAAAKTLARRIASACELKTKTGKWEGLPLHLHVTPPTGGADAAARAIPWLRPPSTFRLGPNGSEDRDSDAFSGGTNCCVVAPHERMYVVLQLVELGRWRAHMAARLRHPQFVATPAEIRAWVRIVYTVADE